MSNLFNNLSDDEKKLLDRYDNLITRGELNRSLDETILDKISLLANARFQINTTRKGKKIDDNYIDSQIEFLKKHPPDYSDYQKINFIHSSLYNCKKRAAYNRTDEGLYTSNDRYRILTPKGQEFADYIRKNSNNSTINIVDQSFGGGWTYRVPNSSDRGKIDHRYAINAKPDITLIKLLDDYTQKHNMYYKTCLVTNWHDRIDSIVIYCNSPQTQEEIDELKKITQPYIRRNDPKRVNDLDGELISDGIVTEKEVDIDMCKKLYAELKKTHPSLALSLQSNLKESSNMHNPLSLGEYTAYLNILDTFKYIKSKTNDKSSSINHSNLQTSHPKSLDESLKDGVNVSLSPESRLSFAPDIEKLSISKDKDGVLHITGASKDGKQSVNFSIRDNIISLDLTNGEIERSYNNKLYGRWTYQNTNPLNQSRYRDNNGEKYAKEFASIIDKLKVAHQQQSNIQQKPRSNYSR